jgi:hypothetical protein
MKKLIAFINFILFLAFPKLVHAAPPQIGEIGLVLDNVFAIILPVGGLIAVAMVVYGGYMWMISGGDSAKIGEAQGTITWAVFGLVFLAIFKFVLGLVFDFLAV